MCPGRVVDLQSKCIKCYQSPVCPWPETTKTQSAMTQEDWRTSPVLVSTAQVVSCPVSGFCLWVTTISLFGDYACPWLLGPSGQSPWTSSHKHLGQFPEHHFSFRAHPIGTESPPCHTRSFMTRSHCWNSCLESQHWLCPVRPQCAYPVFSLHFTQLPPFSWTLALRYLTLVKKVSSKKVLQKGFVGDRHGIAFQEAS